MSMVKGKRCIDQKTTTSLATRALSPFYVARLGRVDSNA